MQPVTAGGLGISGQVLMQRAAQYALDTLLSRCPNARRISIVCGKGNNAGDGYWMALLARRLGPLLPLPLAPLRRGGFTACEPLPRPSPPAGSGGKGIAHHSCLVGIGSLAAVLTGLDVLLGVVPGTTGIRHGQCKEDAAQKSTTQHAAQRRRAKSKTNHHWRTDRGISNSKAR